MPVQVCLVAQLASQRQHKHMAILKTCLPTFTHESCTCMPAQVYLVDQLASQAQHEHVGILKAAGYTVYWVDSPTPKKIMELVGGASHYIAHPLSPEGALFTMQVSVWWLYARAWTYV